MAQWVEKSKPAAEARVHLMLAWEYDVVEAERLGEMDLKGRLLSCSGRSSPALRAGALPIQGLYREAQNQRVSEPSP